MYRHVHHAAALHTVLWAERTLWEDVALRVAVIFWVGIDETAHGAMLSRDLRLDAAPRPAIARDHDRTFHVHSEPRQLFVIVRHTVIHVDQRTGDVAVGGVRVVGRQLL